MEDSFGKNRPCLAAAIGIVNGRVIHYDSSAHLLVMLNGLRVHAGRLDAIEKQRLGDPPGSEPALSATNPKVPVLVAPGIRIVAADLPPNLATIKRAIVQLVIFAER